MSDKGTVFICRYTSWEESVKRILEGAGLGRRLTGHKRILIKPNLVENIKPPVTTPVALVAAIVDYVRESTPHAHIIIGEGTGATEYDTYLPFADLGFSSIAEEKGVELVDLNEAPLKKLSRPECGRWPEMYLPEVVFESYLISVPVLKAHTLAGVTLTMKNMMGLCPPAHYRQGGAWKKASFHFDIQDAVFDLNRYRTPDFTLLDATLGMKDAHLWGPTCNPPPNLLAAGFDPVAIDAWGTGILKRDWKRIGHISKAHGELGIADPLNVVEIM